MSSHREAPEISKDPVADSTDTYAFVSPDRPGIVTLITNYIPLQDPAGGPNFFEFGDDVLYKINVDNNGDGLADVAYEFRFTTNVRNPEHVPLQHRPDRLARRPNFNRPPDVHASPEDARRRRQGAGQGPARARRATSGRGRRPNYADAGQGRASTRPRTAARCSPGSGSTASTSTSARCSTSRDLRPFQNLHLHRRRRPPPASTRCGRSTCTRIAIQVPISDLTARRHRRRPIRCRPTSVIGVWASASRQKALVRNHGRRPSTSSGPFVQVSRLGNPLFNEVARPDERRRTTGTRSTRPRTTQFAQYVDQPELAGLLPVLYPGVFPNLAALHASPAPTSWRSC